ncbi:MAG: hypothetical protein ACRYHA_25850 [Janthinobacterium lividum]
MPKIGKWFIQVALVVLAVIIVLFFAMCHKRDVDSDAAVTSAAPGDNGASAAAALSASLASAAAAASAASVNATSAAAAAAAAAQAVPTVVGAASPGPLPSGHGATPASARLDTAPAVVALPDLPPAAAAGTSLAHRVHHAVTPVHKHLAGLNRTRIHDAAAKAKEKAKEKMKARLPAALPRPDDAGTAIVRTVSPASAVTVVPAVLPTPAPIPAPDATVAAPSVKAFQKPYETTLPSSTYHDYYEKP